MYLYLIEWSVSFLNSSNDFIPVSPKPCVYCIDVCRGTLTVFKNIISPSFCFAILFAIDKIF